MTLCAICTDAPASREIALDGRWFHVCERCDEEPPRLGRYSYGGAESRQQINYRDGNKHSIRDGAR
jgi:hypothetical protein